MAGPIIPPSGLTPLGLAEFELLKPLPPPPVIRADRLNYQTNSFTSMTGDTDPVDAAVIESLWRVRGSGAAVLDKGARFVDIKKLNDQATALLTSEARRALARIVGRGDVTIRSIDVKTESDWAEITVSYVNNRSPFDQVRTVTRRLPEEINT
jgi:hypothetical protein